VRLAVRLTPRAGRARIDGWGRDAAGRTFLKVRLSEPPLDGAANEALKRLIAKALDRPAGAVRIMSGATGRLKQLEVDGVDAADLARAFGAAPQA
jgi:hypothetical protein